MSCLGVHFALSEEEVAALRAREDDAARLEHVQEVIEESYFRESRELMAENDKAWDAMHRTLADGQLTWDGGEYPLNHLVLGGELLYSRGDYIMVLKTPEQVRDVATALPSVTEAEFRRRYFAIPQGSYDWPFSREDFDDTWGWFEGVRDLFLKAAEEGRYVLFTADQ